MALRDQSLYLVNDLVILAYLAPTEMWSTHYQCVAIFEAIVSLINLYDTVGQWIITWWRQQR